MPYTTAEAQQQLLAALAHAAQEIGAALAALGEAHDQLDERSGEQLEDQLFRPLQRAYAQARRTHAEFAARSGMPIGTPSAQVRGAPSHGARGFLADAVEAVGRADVLLAELQDSMLPVEVGDAELRGELSAIRELLGLAAPAAREILRTLGR